MWLGSRSSLRPSSSSDSIVTFDFQVLDSDYHTGFRLEAGTRVGEPTDDSFPTLSYRNSSALSAYCMLDLQGNSHIPLILTWATAVVIFQAKKLRLKEIKWHVQIHQDEPKLISPSVSDS